MPRKSAKPKPKKSDLKQYERFLEAAHKAEASDDPRDLDKALKRVVKHKVRT